MKPDTTPPRVRLRDLRDAWPALSPEERLDGFHALRPRKRQEFFLGLEAFDAAAILEGMPRAERRLWFRLLAPDDAADVVQARDPESRAAWLELLDDPSRREVAALLAYAEDDAGGLMSPRYARVRASMTCDEALRYLRRQALEHLETIYYVYVVAADETLEGVISLRELFIAPPVKPLREAMKTELVVAGEDLDQEELSQLFTRHDLLVVPVVDTQGRMKGIVTIDDIVDVVEEEATEDAQKFGGMEALERPYLETGFRRMIQARAGWLTVLLIGEMLTTSAMAHYEHEIASAVVLAIFIPLIIASGGNSGSQASTLVIRAMALGEVRLRDLWRVAKRELASGVVLGVILGIVGALRVIGWQAAFGTYGEHADLIALTVGLSLLGVVTLGTLAGSMLPFALRRVGFDPASASAPFVATLVDVGGLLLYFTIAQQVLAGTLL